MPCVVVSHDVPEVLSIADHAWILADKKIVAHGSAQALQANPDPRVRQFLDGIADGPVPFRYPAGDYVTAPDLSTSASNRDPSGNTGNVKSPTPFATR